MLRVPVGYGSSQPEPAEAADVHVPRDGFTLATSEQAEI
jgi:hypothetical protein